MKKKLVKEALVDQTKSQQHEWSGEIAAYRWQNLTPFLHKASEYYDIELIIKDRDKGILIETIYIIIKGSKENINEFMRVVEEAIEKA